MRWTQVKKRIEERFAESLRGRLEVHVTRYRKSHDQLFEFWLTLDGVKIADYSDGKSYAYMLRRQLEIEAQGHIKFAAPEAYDEAKTAHYFAGDLMKLLFDSLSQTVEEMLSDQNSVVRSIALADGRLGKRRLGNILDNFDSDLEKKIYELRCSIEGIRIQKNAPTISGS